VSVPVCVRQTPCFLHTAALQCPVFPQESCNPLPVSATHNAEVASSILALSTKSIAYECVSDRLASVPVSVLPYMAWLHRSATLGRAPAMSHDVKTPAGGALS
jgi:hypothetical protein